MQIIIAGHHRASEILEENPNQIDVIFISSPDAVYAVDGSFKIQKLAKECCTLLFNDVSLPIGNKIPPEKEDIQKALDFAKGKDKILVSCQAGVSRSSAIAYLIAAQDVGPIEAFSILNPHIHAPNGLVIKYGSSILKNYDIVDLMNQWKEKADETQMESGWESNPTWLSY